MDAWWKSSNAQQNESIVLKRAVAYYRHSAEIGQENSVEIQSDQVRKWASEHGIEIIKEFSDHGKSGLSTEHRDAFNDMIDNWVKKRDDFEFVLALDVSRWGRFQDIDLSAVYCSECKKHGKQVVFTTIGIPKKDDPLYPVYLAFERYRAAQYSRELSEKVFKGCVKVAQQGYRPGGPPPYAFHRMMLNEQKKPDRILQPGQRKAIQNGRVILVPGNPDHVAIVQEIFILFVEKSLNERQIAGVLNQRGLFSPAGRQWSDASVVNVLTNQQYAGAVVYNKTSRKLKTPIRYNPRDTWVITPGAYDPIVTPEVFTRAQSVFDARKRRYGREELLKRLTGLYEKYAIITSALVKESPDAASPATYCARFGSMSRAFQQMFTGALKKAKDYVASEIGRSARLIDEHEDFLVVNQNFTILIQPSVPIPCGYDTYWEFRPDQRASVDITLGVPLSSQEHGEILGYVALPRLTVRNSAFRLTSTNDALIEMHGYSGLQLIKDIMDGGNTHG